jgi:hypothetical protein
VHPGKESLKVYPPKVVGRQKGSRGGDEMLSTVRGDFAIVEDSLRTTSLEYTLRRLLQHTRTDAME